MNLSKIEEYEKEFKKGTIVDGVIDGEKYFNSKYRIAWYLKEAYTTEVKGWHIKKYYGQEDAYDKFFKDTATQTWHPIIYATTTGILGNFIKWDDIQLLGEYWR